MLLNVHTHNTTGGFFHSAETRKKIHDGIRAKFNNYKLGFAHNHLKVKHTFKPGGTGLIAMGKHSGRVIEQQHDAMGRWTEMRLRGKFGTRITVISVYQSPISEYNERTTFHNQQCIMLERNRRISANKKDRRLGPRRCLQEDLIKRIKEIKDRGDEVLVGGDFNAPVKKEGTICQKIQESCNMHDVWRVANPEEEQVETYQRGSERIDAAMATTGLAKAVLDAQYTEYCTIGQSDHRTIVIDFEAEKLWGGQDPILQQQGRTLHTNNIRQIEPFINKMYDHCFQHQIFTRLEKLAEHFDASKLEKIDQVIGVAGNVAESKLRRKKRLWWSIPLVKARTEHVALKKQYHALKNKQNRKEEMERYLEKRKSDKTVPEDLEECKEAVQEAAEALREIIRKAKEHRQGSLKQLAERAKGKHKDRIKAIK